MTIQALATGELVQLGSSSVPAGVSAATTAAVTSTATSKQDRSNGQRLGGAPSHQERLLRMAARLAIPLDVSLELTHHCNFRCQHCYIPDFSAPDRLDTERILELLDELAQRGTLFLTLTGGEMFLRRDWYAIARRARELGFAVRLLTNGSLIEEEVAERIASLAATVEISLYSMREECFDEITQRPGSFRRTIDGIERLRARGVEVVLKVPVMTFNLGHHRAIERYAERIGASCQVFTNLLPKKNGDNAPLALRVAPADLAPTFGGPPSGCSSAETGAAQNDGSHEDGPLCAAASRYCNISSSGDVMACNILPGSGGNLNERSFREIWESSPWLREVRSIRRRHLHTCKSCSSLSTCGRCHAQALLEDGDLYGPSSHAQARAKVAAEMAVEEAPSVPASTQSSDGAA